MARKRSPLVSQFLENVSREALRDYEPVIREFVRRRHGICVLYRKNRVQYIGLAQNLRNRTAAAARGRPTANGWWFWTYQRAPGEWIRLRELRR